MVDANSPWLITVCFLEQTIVASHAPHIPEYNGPGCSRQCRACRRIRGWHRKTASRPRGVACARNYHFLNSCATHRFFGTKSTVGNLYCSAPADVLGACRLSVDCERDRCTVQKILLRHERLAKAYGVYGFCFLVHFMQRSCQPKSSCISVVSYQNILGAEHIIASQSSSITVVLSTPQTTRSTFSLILHLNCWLTKYNMVSSIATVHVRIALHTSLKISRLMYKV